MELTRWLWTGVAAGTAVITMLIAVSAERSTLRISLPEISLPQNYALPTERAAAQTAPQPEAETAPLPAPGWLLKIEGDTLSVYREGDRTPPETYELPAGALPDYDRILLEYGLKVPNESEMRALLEDYLS